MPSSPLICRHSIIFDHISLLLTSGYPCEVHYITTDDGYILTTFRIPHGLKNGPILHFPIIPLFFLLIPILGSLPPKRPPVLLFHGLIDDSFTWVVNLPHQSLAYLMADHGQVPQPTYFLRLSPSPLFCPPSPILAASLVPHHYHHPPRPPHRSTSLRCVSFSVITCFQLRCLARQCAWQSLRVEPHATLCQRRSLLGLHVGPASRL